MKYTIKPIVCDYAVIPVGSKEIICICNIRRNAELIADILNGDSEYECAFSYDVYPNAKYKVVKADKEGSNSNDIKVGDEVKIAGRTFFGVVTSVDYSNYPGISNKAEILTGSGRCMIKPIIQLEKTGRYFTQIEDVLKQLKGE